MADGVTGLVVQLAVRGRVGKVVKEGALNVFTTFNQRRPKNFITLNNQKVVVQGSSELGEGKVLVPQ